MLPETREERLRCYRYALSNWSTTNYVEFKEIAHQWLLNEFPDLRLKDVCRHLHDFVANGGEIDEQVEKRTEYTYYEFHFDLRFEIGGRRVYFETLLECEPRVEPTITVVSVHDA